VDRAFPSHDQRERSNIPALAALIFAVVLAGLLWLHGNRLVFSNDEGIILDAATRMLHGQTPYRDFFAYMSPGSYWLQEAAFRLFGLSLRAGRVMVTFDFALECALLFWLTARLAGKKAGFAATVLFFAFQASAPEFLLAQHRMDSAALSLASIALCLEGQRRSQAWCWVAAGVLIVGAAVCTPSIALLAPPTLIWLWADRPLRRFLVPYGCGLCLSTAAIAVVMAANGTLFPFLHQMIWLQRNYAEVNIMPYGSMIGGYGAALGAATGADRVIRSLAVFCLALPAVLPVLALAAWSLWMLLRRAERPWAANNAIPYLLACIVMYIASTYPRSDVAHLAFVAALPAALMAVWMARYAPRWLTAGVLGFLAVWAGLFAGQAASALRNEVAVATPVGTLRAAASDAQALSALLQAARPEDALYVHPYMPLLYFLTQGRNPTRYSYLAPGMMTRNEEIGALQSLQKSPPRWLLYLPVSRAEFLRIFPHAVDLDPRFPMIEAWRLREYVPVEPQVIVAGYRLYQHLAGPAATTGPVAAQ
jgi:4-amino-4-deoxy-L-arabinose transferase-like glycosyltransferase